MDPHRIEVFDGADDDDVIRLVTHHFHLELFPANDAFFEQHFMDRGKFQTLADLLFEFVAVVGNPAADTTQCKTGADDHGQPDLLQGDASFVHIVDDVTLADFQADFDHRLFERIAFFGLGDHTRLGTDHFDVEFFEDTVTGEVHTDVQSGLAAERRKNGIGAFNLDDLRHVFPGDRLDVSSIRHLGIGHNRSRIGIDQYDLIALFTKGFAGLSPGVIKFTSLADDNRTGTNNQDLVEVVATRHGGSPCGGAGLVGGRTNQQPLLPRGQFAQKAPETTMLDVRFKELAKLLFNDVRKILDPHCHESRISF